MENKSNEELFQQRLQAYKNNEEVKLLNEIARVKDSSERSIKTMEKQIEEVRKATFIPVGESNYLEMGPRNYFSGYGNGTIILSN